MQRELLVFMDLNGQPELVGRLWARERNGRESSSFAYDPSWLERRGAFALSPSLMLTSGQFHSAKGLANAFSDTAPDSWGQKLMARRERARARKAKTQPRTLFGIDYLAGVDDQTRLGAIRFKDAVADEFLTTTGDPVPPLIDLPRLLSATARIERDQETDEDLLLVLAPGTSLGGARPKATIRDTDGRLLIAKFPKRDDDWPVTLWEAVLLDLAARAGISVPDWRLELIAKKPVVLIRRFDRDAKGLRVPFMSAMTALDGTDHGEQRSYLEIADTLRQIGSSPDKDLEELWRRIVFNILTSNTDDHLRNHAFLHIGQGWRLSPVYDLNPCPTDIKPRVHALAIDEDDPAASIETALKAAPQFGLSAARAKAIAAEVAVAVSEWRAVAKTRGVSKAQIERMSSAFEHDDARMLAAEQKTPPKKAITSRKKSEPKPRETKNTQPRKPRSRKTR
jgi:serine/threonine-protein kinase HipA